MPKVMEEVLARTDDDFMWAVFRRIPAAYADTFIEVFSEITGRAIGKGLGSMFGRIPGAAKVRALKTATMMNWLQSNPGRTTSDFAKLLHKAGWNGVFLEFMEERIAEPPRWALGLEDYPEGGYFSKDRLRQFLIEGLAFSVPGVGHAAIGIFEKGTRTEQQKLFDDIREFGELTRKGLTAEEIWQRSPTMIKDAITKAVDAGEKVEDIIDVQTSVLADVMTEREPVKPYRSLERPVDGDVELKGEVPEPLFMTYPPDYRTQRERIVMASMDIAAEDALEAEETQRLVDAAAKYEQVTQARTEEYTEKWGPLPDGVAHEISNDFPLNPKVEELVYAINSTGVETRMSGDLFSDRAVYIDIHPEDLDRIDEAALPEGWALVTGTGRAVDEFLGDELNQEDLESLEATRNVEDDHRLVRAGAAAVTDEDIDAIVKAMRPKPAIEPEVLPPGADPTRPLTPEEAAAEGRVLTPEEAADIARPEVEAKKKTQFNTTVMEVNGQFQSQLTDGMGTERFTSPIVATEAEARKLAQDWMKAEAERIIAAKEAAPEVAPAKPVTPEPVDAEKSLRVRAAELSKEVFAGLDDEKEIEYAMDYRDFLFGEGEDPGTRLPLDVSGPIRMQLEEIGAKLGIPRPGVPTELPLTPAEVAAKPPAGPLSEFMATLEPGTTFTLTEADIPEISQLEGDAQVAIDRKKFLGEWTKRRPGFGGVETTKVWWSNEALSVPDLTSEEFEVIGSIRMTAAIDRSRVDEPVAPPTAEGRWPHEVEGLTTKQKNDLFYDRISSFPEGTKFTLTDTEIPSALEDWSKFDREDFIGEWERISEEASLLGGVFWKNTKTGKLLSSYDFQAVGSEVIASALKSGFAPMGKAVGRPTPVTGLTVENLTGTGFPIEDGLWGVFRTDPSGQKALLSQFADESEAEEWAKQYAPTTPAEAADSGPIEAGDAVHWRGRVGEVERIFTIKERGRQVEKAVVLFTDKSKKGMRKEIPVGQLNKVAKAERELPPTPDAKPLTEEETARAEGRVTAAQYFKGLKTDEEKVYAAGYFGFSVGDHPDPAGAFADEAGLGLEIEVAATIRREVDEIIERLGIRKIADIEAGAEEPGLPVWRTEKEGDKWQLYQQIPGENEILVDSFKTEKQAKDAIAKKMESQKTLIEHRRKLKQGDTITPFQPGVISAEARMKELDDFPVGTTFELELEDIPPGIEDKDKWTGSWEKIEDPRDETIFWVNGDSGQTVTSDEFAIAEHASGGVFSLRPERPSPNVVDPPATAPPGKKLSPYAEDERETNPGFLSGAETGQPFAARVMQGRGANLEKIYGAQAVKAGVASPVAGAAKYYSFTNDHAGRYGDEITEHDVKLNNPMVIDNDRQWKDLLERADAWALYSVDNHLDAPEERPEAARRLQNYLRTLGHDGIVVKVPVRGDNSPYGEKAKRLRETWGETQVVVFYEDKPMTVSELRDAVLARTDIPEEQVDAWIALLKSHAEGMGMTLQSWVDRTISKVDGKPTVRRKDGKLPPGALDILYQRREPLTEAQFMKVWEELSPALREEKLKTVGEDAVEDAMNSLFTKAWSLRGSFTTVRHLTEFFRVSNEPTQRLYGEKATVLRAAEIEALGASLLVRPQKGPRAFAGWKTLLIEELGPDVDLTGVDLKELYRRSKVVFERTVRATVSGRLPSGETLGKLYNKGEASKHWYDKFWTEIQVVFGEDAEVFANFVAAHSQMTDTSANAERGLEAYIQFKTGVPFTAVGMARNQILANLERAARGEDIRGIKVTNFLKNLMGDLSAVTLDRHMMGIFFGDKNKPPTERQHQIVATTVTLKAKQVGVEPAQYQAALWAAVRDASEERAAPLEKIIFRLLNTDPRFTGLKADLIKNAEDPEAVKELLDAASAENQSKRIPEAEEVIAVTVGFGVDESTVRSIADRMKTPPSEEALRRALDRSSTFLDEQHMEDWFEAQVITGPGRIKGQAAAKAKALERHKPAEQREDRFVSLSLRTRESKPRTIGGRSLGRDATLASPLTGEERLLAAIRGPQPAAEPLSIDPELKTQRRAQKSSQQPMLPLALDMEDEYRTAQAADMFFMDVAAVAEEIVGKSVLSGMMLPAAIRRVLQDAEEPLGISEILKELRARGFKFKDVARARSHLQPTLARMKDLKSETRRDPVTGAIDFMVYFPLPKAKVGDILFQKPGPMTQAEFMTVWKEHANYLRVIAREILRDDDQAQEVRQETFAKAWTRIDRFVDKVHLKNWLNLTTRRHSLEVLRKKRVPKKVQRIGAEAFVPSEGAFDLPKTEKRIFFEEIREMIQPTIQKLPQANKEALLSMFDEVTAPQTAREMGIPVSTLLSRRKVAFDKVREALARYDLDRDDFFQKGKGAIQFLREGRAILHLMEASDISTLIHESAHLFRRDLNAADSGILEDWLKIKDGNWSEQHEETLARALERYLHEGITPEGEPKLARLFEKFKIWLRGIYETITGSPIDIQIPESVRPVLARMLGVTEAAQAAPAKEGALPPTPAEAEVVDPYESVAREFKLKPVPVAKPGFVPTTQHRRVLDYFPKNQTLRVRNGLAYSTNGAISLVTRTDLKDGRYSPYVKGQPKALKKVRADKKAWFPDVGATRVDGHFYIRAFEDLQRAMSVLRTAAPSRMALSTLQLEIKGNTVTLRATDGHRATLNTVPFTHADDVAKEGTYLIPRAAIELVLKDKKTREIEVIIGNGAITMLTDHLAVSAVQVEAEFPNFEKLMPDPARELHVDREGLLRSIKKLKENMDPKQPGVYFWMHPEGTLEMGVLGKEIKKGKSETFTTEIVFTETTPTATASPTNVTILMPRSRAGQENSDFSLDIFHLTDIVEGVSGVEVLIGVPKTPELMFGFAGSSALEPEVVETVIPGLPGRPSGAQAYIDTIVDPEFKHQAQRYLDWKLNPTSFPGEPSIPNVKMGNTIRELVDSLIADPSITPAIPKAGALPPTPDEVKDLEVRTPEQAAGIDRELQVYINEFGKDTGQRDYAILYKDWRLGGDIPFPTEETVEMVTDEQAESIRWTIDAMAAAANVPAREKPEGVDVEEEEEVVKPSDHMQLAYTLLGDLREGIKIDNPALTKRANEAFGGTRGEGKYDPRDAYDAMEVALNMYIEDEGLVRFDDPEGTVKRLAALHALMPVQADRTEEQVEFQQFSSPPDLAFAAVYAAGIPGHQKASKLVALEPSAGTGMIGIMLGTTGVELFVNEKTPRRVRLLEEQEFETSQVDAEFLHTDLPGHIKPDFIVMNPPFSATGGRTKANATKFGAKHIMEALARLNQGGRLVAIVGQGMAMDKPKFRPWWIKKVMFKYTVRANVGIAGKHYRKWGTSFGQQIIVIDKTGRHGPLNDPYAEQLKKVIIGKDLSPQEAIRLLRPLAEEDISGRVSQRAKETGLPPTPTDLPGRREGERGPGPPPGEVLPERRPEGGYQPEARPPGRPGPEELGGVEPGERPLPEPIQPGGREGPGVGEPGGPVEPGRTPGVGGVPRPGDIRPTEPVTGVEEEFGSSNTVFTKEEADKAREEIRKRIRDLGRELETGLPPELMQAMFKLGGFYFEGGLREGLREFGPWSKKMLTDLGDVVRPVLQQVFDTVKGFYEAKAQEDAARFTKERRQAVIEEENPFSPYIVQKHIFAGAQAHPADIVESSYLATVPPPDPPVEGDPGYMKLPEEVITEGRISDLQAEAVQIILQRWASLFPDGKRPGFWLGDGTGLGKGREIGAAIWDNWISGRRRAVWFSTNHQLIADAQRDLNDLGAPMELLQHQDVKTKGTIPDKDGVLFTAYSMPSYHIRSDAPRFNQMVEWMGPDFDGVIAFDESHLLKNAVTSGRGQSLEEGTQRGRMASMLEEMFPKARFLYVSATGATVPRNMGYMTRLGLWGPGLPFATFPDFLQAMSRGGMGAMEMLSRDMKSIGAFISRSISYEGVEYENVQHSLTPMEVNQYNNIADIWTELLDAFEGAITTANQPPGGDGSAFTAFYNAQQRFFLLLMASLKLPTLFTEVAKDLEAGRSIVINLFNTNEDMVTRMVNQARADGIDLAELDFTPRQIIADLIERHFPLYEYIDEYDPVTQENVKVIRIVDGKPVPNQENLEKQQELLDKLADVSFPDNPLDTIVNHFGHQNVAEISGRHRRFEGTEHVLRKIEGVPRKKIDQREIERFQDGEVRIAIITGSAATGISLHSDLSKKNKQRRVFYAFQLSWSADQQLQSFGRVHRSSQSEPPVYKLLRTNLSAEERLVNATSRRLASLGALTSGSRDALGGNLFTIEDLTDVYGEAAVQVTYADIRENSIEGIEGGTPLLEVMGMADNDGNIKQANNADTNVNRFLNRIMALHVDVQNAVFQHFYTHYQRIVLRAQQDGTYDMGIQPIRDRNWNKAERLTLKGEKEIVYTHPHSGAETQLIELIAEFPVPRVTFEQSKGIFTRAFTGITGIEAAAQDLPQMEPSAEGVTRNEGWYVNKKSGKIYTAYKTGRTRFVPNMKAKDPSFPSEQPLWTLTNPKGLAHDVPEYQLDPRFNFDRQHPAEAERIWNAELTEIPEIKTELIDILTGAVMPIYDKVVGLGDDAMTNLSIVRAVLEDGSSYIGMRIGPRDIGPLRERLGIGTPLGEATPLDIYRMVLDNGAIIELDNGWRIRRAKIRGEWRVELDPRGKYNRDELKGYDGVFSERIDYSRRFFIPIDEIEGPKAIEGVLNLHKAVKDILAAGREDPDIPGPAVAGMPEPQGTPRTSSQKPVILPGELPSEPTPTGAIPPTPDQPGVARTRLWAEGIPESAVIYRPRKPEFMPGMPFGSRRLQKEWVDPVTGVVWPPQTVPWIKVRVGQDGGVFPEQVPVDDPQQQVRPIDPILALESDFEMVMPLVNQWEGEDPDTVVSAPEIINSLIKIVEAAGKPAVIRTGRIAERRAAGIFKITIEVIRLAKALNIPAATHEVAHALEKAIYGWEQGGPWIFRTHAQRRDLIKLGQARYGVPGTPQAVKPKHGMMREGWAEFFRVYLTGEEGEAKSRAPHLHKWFMESFMTEHKEVAEAIEETRKLIFKFRLQGSDARAAAVMPWKTPQVGMIRRIIKSVNYMNWFEALAPFERLDNMAMKIRGPDNPLPLVERSFMVASALRNAGPVTVHGWMLR
ncbi:MAG: sigma-70 family RNA polymerase sigma factor, partial [Acidobacteria bacterium]